MYVRRHMRKFIKTRRPNPPARNLLIIDFQDEIIQMYVMPKDVEEGVEKQGRRYFRRSFKSRLKENQTSSIMSWLRQNVNSAIYIRYNYTYIIVNVETKLKLVYYKHRKGSPWIKNLAEAERWLYIQKSERLNNDNIERPNTKWAFIKCANVEVRLSLTDSPC